MWLGTGRGVLGAPVRVAPARLASWFALTNLSNVSNAANSNRQLPTGAGFRLLASDLRLAVESACAPPALGPLALPSPDHRLAIIHMATMADSEYPTPDDAHFAGLVEAATAAADESRSSSLLGKRKRASDLTTDIPIDSALLVPADQGQEAQLHNSAAVLFREPSAKSKKYSRPPLGKVFSSLELAPELFLRLQNAAKDFMLDPNHPERRDVVGHRRHTGGTDVAKLKLWNCVEEFLRDAGNGDRFFAPGVGHNIPGAPERTMFWPEHAQQITKACMPLLRKMVTNERQRLYASETRRSGVKKDESKRPAGQAPPIPEPAQQTADTVDEDEKGQHASVDDLHVVADSSVPDFAPEPPATATAAEGGQVTILINVMKNHGGQAQPSRVIPRFTLTHNAANSLPALKREIKARLKGAPDVDIDKSTVKVWMADGLVPILDDGQWMVALLSAETVEWMDGEVRVLVEV
ncbi:hypothetical protein DV738_g3, partial [Chaetothyriales sp. CBS 135597]